MVVRAAVLPLAAAVSGCSLILDTGDLPSIDARYDAVADGDPSMMSIDATVVPGSILEGAGSNPASRPVIVTFTGANIIGPTITVAWSDGGNGDDLVVVEQAVSDEHDRVALALRVPVRTDRDEGAVNCPTINVTFDQPTSPVAALSVPLVCLDEATTATLMGPIKPLYSSIDLAVGYTFPAGTIATPIRLNAVADITIGALIDVGATNENPGPAGCRGGAAGASASCAGGGAAGESGPPLGGGGGGGGGYAAPGNSGIGNGGGAGLGAGNEMLVPLGAAGENRGGGGGGAASVVPCADRPGGGGGGAIELASGGEVVVGGTGLLVRSGGGGGGAATVGTCGGGGGGSGGAILVRAGAGISFETGARAWLTAPGGRGGTGMGNDGGDGSIGRIRIDRPEASPSGMAVDADVKAGPAWTASNPTVTRSPAQMFELRGSVGRSYGLVVNGATSVDLMIQGGGTAPAMIALQRGLNTICALYDAVAIGAVNQGLAEAKSCIDVAYLP